MSPDFWQEMFKDIKRVNWTFACQKNRFWLASRGHQPWVVSIHENHLAEGAENEMARPIEI